MCEEFLRREELVGCAGTVGGEWGSGGSGGGSGGGSEGGGGGFSELSCILKNENRYKNDKGAITVCGCWREGRLRCVRSSMAVAS